MTTKSTTVLLVEDNEDDVFLLQRALRALPLPVELQLAQDGQEALDYISGTDRFADRARYPVPGLVLLDLKLPYVHGFQVLTAIRSDAGWKDIPVIVLTSSGEDRDQDKTRALGVSHYHLKPPTPALLADLSVMLASLDMAAR